MKKAFVHRYKWSHDKKRKYYRRQLKAGNVVVLEETNVGWLYGIPNGVKLKSVKGVKNV